MIKSLLTILFCILSSISFSQIKGTVTDDKAQPLPFVTIYVENTFNGTTSNTDGQYELNISEPGSYTIIFQYLGFKTVKKQTAYRINQC